MQEEKLKEAFSKIKEDIASLVQQIAEIKEQFEENAIFIRSINEEISQLKLDSLVRNSADFSGIPSQTNPTDNPTHSLPNPTHSVTPTDNPTDAQEIGGWNTHFSNIHTGNRGVPTDRQTNQQTNQQTHFTPEIPSLRAADSLKSSQISQNVVTNYTYENPQKTPSPPAEVFQKPIKQQIFEATEILDSLDNIKKEIRRKFKSITRQEMAVFSAIYVMDERDAEVDYKKVASRLNLSESSIRDYVQKIVNKGIPIEKEKLNNKKILLHISPELKKIATLDTIVKLRGL
jgi:hypothetical protein